MNNSLLIIITMLVAGFFGGITNYFKVKQEKKIQPFLGDVLMGICASFLVPLFLNIISSDLIRESTFGSYKFFVFFGFCLAAALSSKAFIQSISDKLVNDIKKTQEEIKDIREKAEPVLNKETEPSEPELTKMKIFSFGSKVNSGSDFDSNTKEVIEALGNKYAWRTPSGISREKGIEKEETLKILDSLVSEELAVKMHKKNRWGLTAEGRDVFSKISSS
jgi:hypothetical protein